MSAASTRSEKLFILSTANRVRRSPIPAFDGNLRESLFGIRDRCDHNEIFFCSRQRNIEHAHLLAASHAFGSYDCGAARSGVINADSVLRASLHAEPCRRAYEHWFGVVPLVERVLHIGENTYREFKSLALMDGHYADDIRIFGRSRGGCQISARARDLIYKSYKSAESEITRRLVFFGIIAQQTDIESAALAVRHRADQ